MILVTGFGPFRDVASNPSGALARALHGRRVGDDRVYGVELPVSYARGPAVVSRLARHLHPRAILGFGVARGRVGLHVETVAHRDRTEPDVDGDRPGPSAGAPEWVGCTVEAGELAEALGAKLSRDAGRYVCNAWLYDVTRAHRVPVGFVHIADEPLDPDRVAAGLARWSVGLRTRPAGGSPQA